MFDRLSSFESLYRAAERTLRGKRAQPTACAFFVDLDRNLLALQDELRSGAYRPGPYRTFRIRDPKKRLISVAPFRDRVVHHAFVATVEPLFERRFIHHSYACRKGRGTHRALSQFVRWARTSRYVLKMDVKKFFPSVDHAILVRKLSCVIADARVNALGAALISGSNAQEPVARYFPGDDLFTPLSRRVGLPIGNLTSQFFGNMYLDALDHLVKDRLRVPRYLRYVDDFCAFGDDKDALRDLRAEVVVALARDRLRLNEGKSRLRRVKEGITFLGFVVTPQRLRLSSTAVRRCRRRIPRLQAEFAAGQLDWSAVEASLGAWVAHARFGTTGAMLDAVLQDTSFRRQATR